MLCKVLHSGQNVGYRVEFVSVAVLNKLVPKSRTPSLIHAQLGESRIHGYLSDCDIPGYWSLTSNNFCSDFLKAGVLTVSRTLFQQNGLSSISRFSPYRV